MKRLLFIFTFLTCYAGYSQVYVPMPADSGIWRYRIYDIDYITQVIDGIIFTNGQDTIANGHTYRKLMSRIYQVTVPNDSVPPLTDIVANHPDIYYGAFRDSGKKVYLLTLSGEELIYDFNAGVGDSIPAYLGKKKVIAIDSVFLGAVWHKRYRTTDVDYSVIEGVGSSIGLIPDLNDGAGTVQFMCFTHDPENYTPLSTVHCTYVYPIGASLFSHGPVAPGSVRVFPVPAADVLHIEVSSGSPVPASMIDVAGRQVWHGVIDGHLQLWIDSWPRGLYYLHLSPAGYGHIIQKVIIE